ncbi:MAG: OmpA family protein [Bacteroidales bacterium]|nr:OmpA family protein [Bacteroidales bacterium]
MFKSFFIITFLSFTITFGGFSQKRSLKKADEAFNIGEYHIAYDIYEATYEKLTAKEDKANVSYKLGECSRIMMNERKAAKWYKKATRYEIKYPVAWLYLANAQKMLGKYEEAKENYKKYQNLVPNDSRGKNGVKSCEFAQDWIDNPTRFTVEIAEDINSSSSDFCPSFGKSKSEIYFSSTRESANGKEVSNITGQSYSDIFVVTKDRKGKWSVPVPVDGNVNSPGSEGSAVIINEGSIMYFSMCKQTEGANMGCKIYKSKNNAGGWSDPQEVVLKGDSTVSVGHPAVSEDELIMYFVSDSIPGVKGFGGKDIYFVKRESATSAWGNIQNAGSKINTKGDEKFPYLRQNGELYFASDGHVGMGGLDIFKAKKNGTVWEVENMRYPINSSKDDFGITFYENKSTGYFSSKRNKKINIYSFSMPDLIFTMRGLVKNSDANAPLPGANVKLTSPSGHEVEITSASDGTFRFNLKPKTDYSVIASKSKFLTAIADRSTKGLTKSKEFDIVLELEPYGNKQIELPNIEYALGSVELRPESMVSLDKLVQTLTVNSNITIELAANTDFRGSEESNQILSEGRAQSVIDYLISKEIKADRLTPVGNGEKVPKKISSKTKVGRKVLATHKFLKNGDVLTEEFINNLETEEQKEICHQLNRRTEFRVLRDDYGINAVKFGGGN